MKSRKVKAYEAYKRRKADLPLEENDSDVDPDSFFHDEIDDLNDEKDNELSTDDELIQHRVESSDEEEVLPITDDESEESEGNKLENDESSDEDSELGLPNREAWGKKKFAYYSADFVDEDRGKTYREEDAEAAKAEAEEAFAIQKSVYSNINADNLGANLFLEGSDESSGEEEKVDLISATKEEKLKYIRTETKILEVTKEFKSAMDELKKFSNLIDLIERQNMNFEELEKYIRTKNSVLSLYCLNLCLYMMLASSGKNLKYHPVMQRISSFKQLLEKLEPTDKVAAPVIDKILDKGNYDEDVDSCTESKKENVEESTNLSVPQDSIEITSRKEKVKKRKVKHVETESEKQVVSLCDEVKKEIKKRKLEEMDEHEMESDNENEPQVDVDNNNNDGDDKRIINYQIAKNKGLTPYRRKEFRNPRVRHRMKFRKAQIRRKGQVRGVYKEIKRYDGEFTGINANVIKSRKFK